MKNLVKTKKMSLSTIEGKLTKFEMETIMAGSMSNLGCAAFGFFGVAFYGAPFSIFRGTTSDCWNR
jgi:hypothetical protein